MYIYIYCSLFIIYIYIYIFIKKIYLILYFSNQEKYKKEDDKKINTIAFVTLTIIKNIFYL